MKKARRTACGLPTCRSQSNKMIRCDVVWLLLPLFISAAVCAAEREDWRQKMQPISPRGYLCRHAAAPIKIDGLLDDAAWGNAPWTGDFVDIQGDGKSKPRFRTRAK